MQPREVVAELWRRIEARDWDGLRALLTDGFVLEWPAERVRVRGPQEYVEFNRDYPEGWSIEVLRVVADGNVVVSEVRVPHRELGPFYALSFFEVEADRVARGREFWLEERYEELSPERRTWFEPI